MQANELIGLSGGEIGLIGSVGRKEVRIRSCLLVGKLVVLTLHSSLRSLFTASPELPCSPRARSSSISRVLTVALPLPRPPQTPSLPHSLPGQAEQLSSLCPVGLLPPPDLLEGGRGSTTRTARLCKL
jgi:hypothetical protein